MAQEVSDESIKRQIDIMELEKKLGYENPKGKTYFSVDYQKKCETTC